MGEAERIILAREAQQTGQRAVERNRISLELATEIENLIPDAVDALKASGYRNHTRFIDLNDQTYAAWELFNHFQEGDITGYRIYLLAEGQLVEEYQYLDARPSKYVPFDMHEKMSYSPDPSSFDANLQALQALINEHTQLAQKSV